MQENQSPKEIVENTNTSIHEIPSEGDTESKRKVTEDHGMSKRAIKRKKRREIQESRWKEKKNAKRILTSEKENVKELDMSPEAVLRRKEKQISKRETFLMSLESGYSVVIDCDFDQSMAERQIKSLSQQIFFSYGANRHSQNPMKYDQRSIEYYRNLSLTFFRYDRTCISSLNGNLAEQMGKISGFDNWLGVIKTSRSYMDLFNQQSLVYLTADSPNVLDQLDHNKVYVIGGIVDRNRLKGETYRKAQEQGIATAKLPLDKCVQLGASSRVLTVNHVYQIMLEYARCKEWKDAILSVLPQRKGAQVNS